MTNFGFVRATLPAFHADCAKAEEYLTSDSRSACFYSRRAVEGTVRHLYELRGATGCCMNSDAYASG